MRRQNESFGELLLRLPWWVSAAFGIVAFAGVRWGISIWAGEDTSCQMLAKAITPLAPLPLLVFGIFAVGSFYFARRRSRLVEEQTSLEKLRETPWKDFECLVAEAYRRQGYQVEYSLGRGADGGVDLTLHKDGHKSLVQCKQWKVFSVGAHVVREMFGLMTAEKADQAIIVTTGGFTREARNFAADKPLQLVDGPQLFALVQSVQTTQPGTESRTITPSNDSTAPACPLCGKPMVQRTARRGSHAGSQFWGCSAYPACKGIRN